MLLKKGIVRKTFLFSILLILLVTLISFAVMYFTMPGYYRTQKAKKLFGNLNALTVSLQSASTEEECAALIAEFSDANNANIFSFDKDDSLLPMMSTPFINMGGIGDTFYLTDEASDGMRAGLFRIQLKTERVRISDRNPGLGENVGQDNVSVIWKGEIGVNSISLEGEVGSYMVDHILAVGTLQPIDEAKGVILSLIPYVLLIAVFVGFVLSGVYARQISKPVLQISDAALRMQKMEPGVVSAIKTNDELGQLSANLDALYASLLSNIGQLKDEMDKVNRLEQSKTEMMQSASHELKTPISALGGMLEGMLDNIGAYKDREKYLVECKNQVDRLSALVSEILCAAKADAVGAELELCDVLADELVERALDENMHLAHEKKLKLIMELQPVTIVSEPDILYRAVSNLISNAMRYASPEGEVRVTVSAEGSAARLCIENECERISEGELAKLFEPFYTRSYSRDKTKSGTGLGLYIVRRSLERLDIPYEAKNTETGFMVCLRLKV